MLNSLAQYDPELEMFEGEKSEVERSGALLESEMGEMALAARLLDVPGRGELPAVIASLITHAERTLGMRATPALRQRLKSLIDGTLRRAAPRPSAEPDNPFGQTLGGRLASVGGTVLGLELEGLSDEDGEFETARQLVRFAIDAVTQAIRSSEADPARAARVAVIDSARRNAPGLLRQVVGEPDPLAIGAPRRPSPPRGAPSRSGATDQGGGPSAAGLRMNFDQARPPAESALPARGRDGASGGRWSREGRTIVVHQP